MFSLLLLELAHVTFADHLTTTCNETIPGNYPESRGGAGSRLPEWALIPMFYAVSINNFSPVLSWLEAQCDRL